MTREERIFMYLEEQNTADIVEIHNEYCSRAYYPQDVIYRMADFNEEMEGQEPQEIACKVAFGQFNPFDSYFWYDGNANIRSANTKYPMPIDLNDIAEYIDSHDDALGNAEIRDILEIF